MMRMSLRSVLQGAGFGLIAGGLFGGFFGWALYESDLFSLELAIAFGVVVVLGTGAAFAREMQKARDAEVDEAMVKQEHERQRRQDLPLAIVDIVSFGIFLLVDVSIVRLISGVVTILTTTLLVKRAVKRP